MRTIGRSFLITLAVSGALAAPASAQEPQEIIGPILGTIIDQIREQQRIEAWKNSPEGRAAEIQPGGLTRAQVTVVQQLLLQRGYDIGTPDGVVGPKTMTVVAQLQKKAGVPATGLPNQQLLDALLQPQ